MRMWRYLEYGLFTGTAEALAHRSWRLTATVICGRIGIGIRIGDGVIGDGSGGRRPAGRGAQFVWQSVGFLPRTLLHFRFQFRLQQQQQNHRKQQTKTWLTLNINNFKP